MHRTLRLLRPVFALVALVWLAPRLNSAQAPAPLAALDLQDGDTLVFLGDSITHQCLYTQYVEDFFYTRYPERRIRFHNAGVSGDKAADVLARFDDDVAAFKPKYVTVLLGMNDGQYEDFRAEVFATYAAELGKVLDRIKAIGATPILLSPTLFDYPVVERRRTDPTFRFRERSFAPNYNAVMAYYGAWGRDQAARRGVPFVNLWGPLNDFTTEERVRKPEFTLVPDAIHPGPGGQFVMASAILEDQRPERRAVSAIMVTRAAQRWTTPPRQPITELAGDATRVSFSFKAPALPWVVPAESTAKTSKWEWHEDVRTGVDLTKAGHRLSNEMLRVTGLAPGNYDVRIDGQSIGRPVGHVQLGAKIELQSNEQTPQYRQALQVALLNRERNDLAIRPLRDVWSGIKGARRRFSGNPEQFAEFMRKTQPELERLQKLARDYEERIYAAAQPVARRYEIVRVETPAPARGKKKE
jgi:lysophospholipase L1-like esterase